MEESGLTDVKSCEDVPAWARISDIHAIYGLEKRKVVLVYYRKMCMKQTIKTLVRETLDWSEDGRK